jgi:hypothetical protein
LHNKSTPYTWPASFSLCFFTRYKITNLFAQTCNWFAFA